MTSGGAQENSAETWNVSRGRFGDIIEAEARFILTLVEELVAETTKF